MVTMFDSGDPAGAADLVAADYLDHQGLGEGKILGVDGFTHVVLTNAAAHEEQQVSIADIFGAEDRAVARVRWRGRRRDGSTVDRETIDIVRVVDGQAVEHWGAHG